MNRAIEVAKSERGHGVPGHGSRYQLQKLFLRLFANHYTLSTHLLQPAWLVSIVARHNVEARRIAKEKSIKGRIAIGSRGGKPPPGRQSDLTSSRAHNLPSASN